MPVLYSLPFYLLSSKRFPTSSEKRDFLTKGN